MAETATPLTGGVAASATQIRMWRSGQLCDLTIVVGGEEFKAHRVVLTSASRMCAAEMRESHAGVVTLSGMLPRTFSACLTFMYTGECLVYDLEAMLEASERLQIETLIQATLQAFMGRMDSNNCLRCWGVAERYEREELGTLAFKLALKNFPRLPREALVELTELQLQTLLGSDGLVVTREEDAYETLLAWAHRRAPDAIPASLLKTIRYPAMDKAYMRDAVHVEALMRTADAMEALARSFQDVLWQEIKTGRQCFYVHDWAPTPRGWIFPHGSTKAIHFSITQQYRFERSPPWAFAISPHLERDCQWTVVTEEFDHHSEWGIVVGVAQQARMQTVQETLEDAQRTSVAALGAALESLNPVLESEFAYICSTGELRGSDLPCDLSDRVPMATHVTIRYRSRDRSLEYAVCGKPFRRVRSGLCPSTSLVAFVAVSGRGKALMQHEPCGTFP